MSLNYKSQNLFVDNTSIKSIAKNNITPFYVYSYKKIKNNFENFSNYFKKINPIVNPIRMLNIKGNIIKD